MTFSVIVPVYNVEKYVKRCINSILNQTFKDFELIIVNDGSTDSSRTICESYLKNSKIHLINKENGGPSSARNAGLNICKGDYVIFIDSDDYVKPRMLEKINKAIEKTNSDSIIYNLEFEKNNKTIMTTHYSFQEESKDITNLLEFYTNCLLIYKIGWEASTRVYKHSTIKKHNLRFNEDIKIAEDLCFTFEYYLYAKNFYVMKGAFYHYNTDNINSIMHVAGNANHFNEINKISLYLKSIIPDSYTELKENFSTIHYLLFKNEIQKIIKKASIKTIKKMLCDDIKDIKYFNLQCKLLIKKYKNFKKNNREYYYLFNCFNKKWFADAYLFICTNYYKIFKKIKTHLINRFSARHE